MTAHLMSTTAEDALDAAAVLALLPREWSVLSEVAWPGRPGQVIDHIVIGPAGAFAVVSGDDPTLARAAAQSVAALVPGLPRGHVHSILVGVDQPVIWSQTGGVFLCTTEYLARLLRSLPRDLTSEVVAGVVSVVHVGLERAERVRAAAAEAAASQAPTGHVVLAPAAPRRAGRTHRRSRARWLHRVVPSHS